MAARKDLGITKLEQLKGMKIANQVGSSIAGVFTDTIGPQHGLKKGDYQEVRMDVNNMVAALAAKTIDAMVNVEPYNVIAEADGIGVDLIDFSSVDKMPVFMAATPDFVEKSPDTVVAYLKAWLDVAKDFKQNPKKVADVIYSFYTDKGYKLSKETFQKAMSRVEVDPGFPSDLKPYMQEQAEILLKEKKIAAIPDWSKALRPDFMERPEPTQHQDHRSRKGRACKPDHQELSTDYLELQVTGQRHARRLRRHGRRHVGADRQGRPPHHLAGA